jgi:hypothetical protein
MSGGKYIDFDMCGPSKEGLLFLTDVFFYSGNLPKRVIKGKPGEKPGRSGRCKWEISK